ncbi:MAG: CBS domain-containing protein [Clostridium sp.]|nr:CBS domain-containing protein [Clostridium sp.]
MSESFGNAKQFVQIYNQIDEYMKNRLGQGSSDGSYSTRIRILAKQDSSFKKYQDILISYGELRNAIVHDYGRDEYRIIAEPYTEEVERYQKVKEELMKPTLAYDDIAVKSEVLYSLSPEDRIAEAVSIMDRRNFNFAPILYQGRVMGVFSPETIFSYLADYGEIKNTDKMMMKEIKNYTNLSSKKLEGFLFLPLETTVVDVEALFSEQRPQTQRLEVVFITKNGKEDEALLGMVTIWDLAKAKNQ